MHAGRNWNARAESNPRCAAKKAVQDQQQNRRGLLQAAIAGSAALLAPVTLGPEESNALDKDFQDDPELLRKAKEERQQKLQEEMNREREFTRSEGYKPKARTRAAGTVQTAVNQLSRTGEALERGDLQAVAQLVSCAPRASFPPRFKRIMLQLSISLSLFPFKKSFPSLEMTPCLECFVYTQCCATTTECMVALH